MICSSTDFYRSFTAFLSFFLACLITSAAIFILTPAAFAASEIVDDISADAVWTAVGSPYVLSDGESVDVLAGVTLTIEPGVVVKFGDDSSLNIDGILNALGSSGAPIIFTSLFDDVGGDTNGDGGATFPTPFDLWWLNFYGLEGSSASTLRYATIRNSQYGPYVSGATLSLENFTFEQSDNGFYVDSQGTLLVSDSVLGGTYGDLVTADGGSYISVERSVMRDVFSGDVFGLYSGTYLFLDESRIEDIGDGSAIGLYSAHATTTKSVISGGIDSALEPYDGSSLTILDSTIENFSSTAVYPYESRVLVQDSIIRGNDYGVYASGASSEVSISGSVIADNISYGVYDEGGAPTDARGNFWGDATGPFHPALNPSGFGDEVSDNVNFSGWLAADPFAEPSCCSSVAFIPGIEASRLYRPGAIFENQLWEPNTNNDVRALALDPITGESVNADIYTDDVIDEAFTVNIYKNFLSFMEDMVTAGDIADFETFPYDWRFDVKDVVGRAVMLRDESYEMIPRLRRMASSSQTGKVTIIAHSNGGLVAKELLNVLKNSSEGNLVDKVILAATPELGTPKAVMEMLHGMEPFALNFPREEVTRELAENMKSAYALLPSAEYFNQLGISGRPIIEFSTTTAVTLPFRGIYGETISSYGDLRKFILGDNGARLEPPADVNLPNVLKGTFLSQAEARHGELDAWQPPAGVDVVRIIGWGLETPRGLVYKSAMQNVCNADFSVCAKQEVLDPEPLSTAEGDGTVVYLSADALGGERYYVNVFDYNRPRTTVNRKHKNILEIESLQELISTLVKKEATTTLPIFISAIKPETSSIEERLRIDVHSPVMLNLYDSLGRHTGPIPNPDSSSDLELSEEQIPNSYYWRLGEGQYAGAGGTGTTTVKLVGTALGSATVGIERVIGDETIISGTIFEDVPITAGGTATVEVVPNVAPTMLLDVDGDGVVDAEITTDGFSPEDLVAILKSLIKTLDLPHKKEKQILKAIDKLEKELAREHKKEKVEKLKTEQAFKHLLKIIKQYQKKKVLSVDEASELIRVIEEIMSKVVK